MFAKVYRIVVAAYYKQLAVWQSLWLPSWAAGAARHREPVEAYVDTSMKLAAAELEKRNLHGALLDSEKHFDSYKKHIVSMFLYIAGLPYNLIMLMQAEWSARISIRVAGHYGRFWTSANGVNQGSSFSLIIAKKGENEVVLMINLLGDFDTAK